MVNSSVLQSNVTQESITASKMAAYIKYLLILLMVGGLCIFIYFITVMLNVFFTTPHLREKARYVLFVYMLINDTIYLILAIYLSLASIYLLYVPVPVCYILYMVSSMAFKVTPYNLAAMALEQYVAICYPFRHVELCTPQRANGAFIVICTVLMIPYAADLCLMFSSFTNIFHLYVICREETLVANPVQTLMRSINVILCFTLEGLVILFTYVKIILVAQKVSSHQSSSASKAAKTIMLHAFQLLLYMASLLSTLTKTFHVNQIELLPISSFIVFTCVPRYLSPIIYGIRDEVLRNHIKKSLPKHFP